ncbi:chorismate mutase/prephenate dehydrogenase [Tahibacter aquaticus]|uniref:chorismate mutase n=2 Tax=Tahibacter aquaticus TaxID=520092 RepID=A0A4R6YM95_9GAMM|nr:chorismate mutase/prephenate dehydrogenase [Tahibacter aquaticus]
MKVRQSAPLPLAMLRALVDALDDGLITLLAARRMLVGAIAVVKAEAHIATCDPARECYVHNRALRLARRLGVPATTARAVIEAAIADARGQQNPPLAAGPERPASQTCCDR